MKRIKYYLLFSITAMLLTIKTKGQYLISLPKNSEPGKCYSQCTFYTKEDTTIQKFYVLKESVHSKKSWFNETSLEFDPKYHHWIIPMTNEASGSLIAFEESKCIKKIKVKTLKDKALQRLLPSQVDTLRFAISWKSYINDKWEEVLCADKINFEVWERLSQKLKDLGYLDTNHIIGPKGRDELIINALKSFQNETFGHYGSFSKETFEKLGLGEYFAD